ncbi:unnamed protein product [Albugo candida]|nr:unnamed protein product [Albugo candida]|eukprot:CCI50763.1 unnamed protein product [Albugo candida]
METAKQKAERVFADVSRKEPQRPTIVVGCDTIVVLDNQVLEKPQDEEEAIQMLQQLSNKTHTVYSAVAIYTTVRGRNSPHIFTEKTLVTFQDLSLDAIKAYAATGEPMDKAGAYGIQGRARCFVASIQGCLNNVIGFPLDRFFAEMRYLERKNEI